MTPKEMIRLLKKNGFIEKGQVGSHMKFFNPSTNRTVIVPMHGAGLRKGTENAIIKQAGILK
jgi:predicted RNA binding protein YcfA (HicA-like mRNA interferase family)